MGTRLASNGNTVEINNKIMFDFYQELLHTYYHGNKMLIDGVYNIST